MFDACMGCGTGVRIGRKCPCSEYTLYCEEIEESIKLFAATPEDAIERWIDTLGPVDEMEFQSITFWCKDSDGDITTYTVSVEVSVTTDIKETDWTPGPDDIRSVLECMDDL